MGTTETNRSDDGSQVARIVVGAREKRIDEVTILELGSTIRWFEAIRDETGLTPQEERDLHAAVLMREHLLSEATSPAEVETEPVVESGNLLSDVAAVNARLASLRETHNVIAPDAALTFIPEGFSVEFSFVQAGPQDAFSTDQDKCLLRMRFLLELARLAGVDWMPAESGPADDGRTEHVREYLAVCKRPTLDGARRIGTGTSRIDLRDGSKRVRDMRERLSADEFEEELSKNRRDILSIVESAAKIRAVVTVGIRREWTTAELERPFAVVRLTATGRSDDAEVRRELAKIRFQQHLSDVSSLYGARAQETRGAA